MLNKGEQFESVNMLCFLQFRVLGNIHLLQGEFTVWDYMNYIRSAQKKEALLVSKIKKSLSETIVWKIVAHRKRL